MTELEALNRIKHIIDSSKVPNNFDSKQYLEDMKYLTNSLEVLEILGKYDVLLVIGNKEDYDKVKSYFERKK